MREAITLKDQQITTLEEMNRSYDKSLTECGETNATLSKKLTTSKAVNKVLVLAAGVLTAILVLK